MSTKSYQGFIKAAKKAYSMTHGQAQALYRNTKNSAQFKYTLERNPTAADVKRGDISKRLVSTSKAQGTKEETEEKKEKAPKEIISLDQWDEYYDYYEDYEDYDYEAPEDY